MGTKFPSATGISANCTAKADTFYQAQQDLDVTAAQIDALQAKKVGGSLSAADLQNEVDKLAAKEKALATDQESKQAVVAKIEKEIADANCDEAKTYDAGDVCAKLLAKLEAANTDLNKIQALLATLQKQIAAQQAVATQKKMEGAAASDDDDKKSSDDGNGSIVIIMICGVIIVCLIVVAVVVVSMTGGNGGGHDAGDLYDEPTFNADATGGTQGGYLDVAPDDDDDEDDSSEEDDSDDE